MLRRSGLEQLLGCMRMSLFVSASGASGEIYRLRKARAQAESGASEGNRDAKRQRWKAGGLAEFVRRADSVKKRLLLLSSEDRTQSSKQRRRQEALWLHYTRGY